MHHPGRDLGQPGQCAHRDAIACFPAGRPADPGQPGVVPGQPGCWSSG